MLVNKDFLSYMLIGWQMYCHLNTKLENGLTLLWHLYSHWIKCQKWNLVEKDFMHLTSISFGKKGPVDTEFTWGPFY